MNLADFNFSYSESQIALTPLERRPDSRLFCVSRQPLSWRETSVRDLPQLLNEDFVLVFNESPVIAARFFARKESGGEVEGLLLHSAETESVSVWLQGRVQVGEYLLLLNDERRIRILQKNEREITLDISLEEFQKYLAREGLPGIPPYIRKARKRTWGHDEWVSDPQRYQSVLARAGDGSSYSVAAPTASLHFDKDLMQALDKRGVQCRFLKLDVGAGTFAPLEEKMWKEDRLHSERVELGEDVFAELKNLKNAGKKIISVGTTTLRALESAALRAEQKLALGRFETDIFIHPQKSFPFRMVDGLFTNFHQPQSSLLLLVARFMEPEAEKIQHHWRKVYTAAIEKNCRLFSYGDAMLIL